MPEVYHLSNGLMPLSDKLLVYDPNYNPETATPPSPELMAEMGKFIEEATKAGVVVATGALNPKGTRLHLSSGKFTVTDGPFIELKELLAGFAVIQVKSLEEAIEWSKRFRKIVGDGESEIVQLFGPDDFDHA
ncbi:MAG TPA: YciI family protein [Anaerolineae bacterium]|nr:YciI family protein [Anaerolineae bacterium]